MKKSIVELVERALDRWQGRMRVLASFSLVNGGQMAVRVDKGYDEALNPRQD